MKSLDANLNKGVNEKRGGRSVGARKKSKAESSLEHKKVGAIIVSGERTGRKIASKPMEGIRCSEIFRGNFSTCVIRKKRQIRS